MRVFFGVLCSIASVHAIALLPSAMADSVIVNGVTYEGVSSASNQFGTAACKPEHASTSELDQLVESLKSSAIVACDEWVEKTKSELQSNGRSVLATECRAARDGEGFLWGGYNCPAVAVTAYGTIAFK
jgi:hypothetical protein